MEGMLLRRLRVNRLWRSYRVARLLLATLWIMNRERTRVIRARARGEYDAHPNVAALVAVLHDFRMTAVALGGLLIKLGQFLSARADLLPQEALAELAALQDEVPAESFDAMQRVVERELGAPLSAVFSSFEATPAGSASLGQVHRAVLRDGRVVAVKVQRPGIHQIIRTDLATLRFVLRVVRLFAPSADQMVDTRGLYREFSRTVHEELDYQREGRYAERFARIFTEEPDIIVPGIIWECSTRCVLVLEWIDGIKVTNLAALDAAGVDRDALARRLIATYFKQVLEVGFYHADPHPGNILVLPEPDGMHVAFLDFGMMGAITSRMRGGLRDSFLGVVQQDAALIVRGLGDLGFLGEMARRDVIEQAISLMLAQFSALPFGQIRDVDPRDVAGDVETMLYEQPLRLPVQFAFLGRALGMLLGLATALSPDINFIEVATPYASQFLRQDGLDGILRLLGVSSVNQLGLDLVRESVSLVRSVSAIPRRFERVLERAEQGNLHLVIESPETNQRQRKQVDRRIVGNMFNRPVPVWVPLSIAGVFVVTRVMRVVRRRGAGA